MYSILYYTILCYNKYVRIVEEKTPTPRGRRETITPRDQHAKRPARQVTGTPSDRHAKRTQRQMTTT